MKTIYVGNLSFQITAGELRNLFAKYGKIDQVSVPRDVATGRARGFAFVEMQDEAAAVAAIRALNGSRLGDRTIIVNEARPKPGRAEPRGDGERRFGRG
jgi:cold-inducible RNA-binding protein